MTAAVPDPRFRDQLAEVDPLRDALRIHHPIMRSETGPFSGCRCGAVKLGQDVIAHVVTEIRAAVAAEVEAAAAQRAAEELGEALGRAATKGPLDAVAWMSRRVDALTRTAEEAS